MSTIPLHISAKTHADLKRLQRELDKPADQILDQALEEYECKRQSGKLRDSWERLRRSGAMGRISARSRQLLW